MIAEKKIVVLRFGRLVRFSRPHVDFLEKPISQQSRRSCFSSPVSIPFAAAGRTHLRRWYRITVAFEMVFRANLLAAYGIPVVADCSAVRGSLLSRVRFGTEQVRFDPALPAVRLQLQFDNLTRRQSTNVGDDSIVLRCDARPAI